MSEISDSMASTTLQDTLMELRRYKLNVPILLTLYEMKTAYQWQIESRYQANEQTVKSAITWLAEHKLITITPRKAGSRIKEDYTLTKTGAMVARVLSDCIGTVSKLI